MHEEFEHEIKRRRVNRRQSSLCYVYAADEKAAIDAAAKEYEIADALRDQIVARRKP